MSFPGLSALALRLRGELPPAAPLPAALQTLGCRVWPLGYLERCHRRYGHTFTVYPIDMAPLVFLSDPGDIRAMLAAPPADLHAGAGGVVMAPLFGEQAFMLREQEHHKCGRSSVSPLFQRKAVEARRDAIQRLAEEEVARWPTGDSFSAHPCLMVLALRIIMDIAIVDKGSLVQRFCAALAEMLGVMASLVLQEPRLRHLPGWRGQWKRMVRQRAAVDSLVFELIRTRRRREPVEDVLGVLLLARNPDGSGYSDRQVRDNLVSLLITGIETTAAELAWALQLLAHNQTVQERLAHELECDEDSAYLTATVQEVLRRRPAFLFTAPRIVARPVEIGGRRYPPSVQLLSCIYLLHHDPALFEEPRAFRPERFLKAPPSSKTWLPWGGGRRRCLGQHLAMLEMETVLRAVVAQRRVLPASPRIERARWRTVLVAPHAGCRVILSPRREVRPARQAAFVREGATV
jgi:cytochrome P450